VSEAFAAPTAAMTVVRGGTWTVTGGRYALTNPASGAAPTNGNLAVHQTGVGGNFTLSALAATTPNASVFNDFAIVFGFRDPANYYYVSSNDSNDATTSGIFKVAGGATTQLADIPAPIVAGTLYQMRIERDGTAIRAYRNNTLIATATDAATITGKVGFATPNDGAAFDNLIVTGFVGA
jgi:hypothetical protein